MLFFVLRYTNRHAHDHGFSAALPIGEYAAVALLAFFGFKSIKDAWALPDKKNGELQENSESGELAEAEELVKEEVVLFRYFTSVESSCKKLTLAII